MEWLSSFIYSGPLVMKALRLWTLSNRFNRSEWKWNKSDAFRSEYDNSKFIYKYWASNKRLSRVL